MKVIIAGGSGLIGQALSRKLIKNNHQVVIISRRPDQLDHLAAEIQTCSWDKEEIIPQISQADAVVNLAGASIAGQIPFGMRWTAERKQQILESRVNAGKALSAAINAAKRKPSVFIQASGIGAYGPRGDEFVDETTPYGDDFLAEVSRAWEASTKQTESLGVRRVVIRTGLVLSQRGGLFPLLKFPFQLFVGGRIGSGEQYLSWIHIDDEVNAIQYLIENPSAQGVFNLCAPIPVSNHEFAQQLGRVMNRPAFVPVPAFLLRLLLGEAATLALDGQRAFPRRLQEVGYQFRFERIEGALAALLAVKNS
jgi:uncharacterized protein (TIGR01777 family)